MDETVKRIEWVLRDQTHDLRRSRLDFDIFLIMFPAGVCDTVMHTLHYFKER